MNDIKMSKLTDKIKDIFSRVDIAANGQVSTSYWADADNNLSAPDGMDYWEWIEQATNNAINEADALVEQNKALRALLKEVQAIIESSPAVTDTIWYNDQNTLYDEIYLRINGDDKCEQLNLLEQSK